LTRNSLTNGREEGKRNSLNSGRSKREKHAQNPGGQFLPLQRLRERVANT